MKLKTQIIVSFLRYKQKLLERRERKECVKICKRRIIKALLNGDSCVGQRGGLSTKHYLAAAKDLGVHIYFARDACADMYT